MAFIIDSNVFIEAHRTTYPLDIATGFWNTIKELAEGDHISSIDKVYKEIAKNEDELLNWIDTNLPEQFFLDSVTTEIFESYGEIASWAESVSNHYKRKAIDDFLEFDRADAWLVAYCKANKNVLVTQEVSRPEQKSAIPIPQVCLAHGVQYCNTIELFRELGVRF